MIYFRFRDLQVGSRKLNKVCVGAGRSLRRSQFAVTVHDRVPGIHDAPSAQTSSKRLSSSRLPDMVALLTGIDDQGRMDGILKYEVIPGMMYPCTH